MRTKKLVILIIAILALVFVLTSCATSESAYVKISFYVDGTPYESYWVKKGGSLDEEPEVPDKEGMTGVWSVTDYSELNADLRVDAIYTSAQCSITFMVDNRVFSTISVKKNSTPSIIPAVPEKEGFEGTWNYNNFTNISQDITVTALYTPIRCTISFMNGNDLFATRITEYGGNLQNVPVLPSSGRDLSARWTNEDGSTPIFTNIKSDFTVYAYYYITVTLINSYSTDSVLTFDVDDEVASIAVGQRTGYDFYGWYFDEHFTQKAEFPIVFEENRTLYARWLKTSNAAHFTFADGMVTGYTGSDTDVVIPYKYTDSEDNVVFVTGIGNNAFSSPAIETISIPGTVTYIGTRAFSGCSSLTNLIFPDQNNIETIGAYAFENCVSLTEFAGGFNLKTIGDYAFTNCNSLEEVVLGGATTIGEYAFSGITTIDALAIPATVTTIGACAFQNMTNAVFSFPDGNNVVYVGDRAFANCLLLTGFTAPRLQTMGRYVFINCRALQSVTMISNGQLYKLFGTTTFENSYEINDGEQSYFLPKSLVSVLVVANPGGEGIVSGVMAENALLDAYYVKSVTLSGNFTTIESYAFKLTDVSQITSPVFTVSMMSVSKIASYAFSGRKDMVNIVLPASVAEIGEYAFYGLDKLSNVAIAQTNGLTKIGKGAFEGTKWLKEYTGVAKLGKIAIGFGTDYISTGGRTALIPEDFTGVTIIAPNAFEGNTSLVEIILPSTITTIGRHAFRNCINLRKIDIPVQCESLGADMLSGCYNLNEMRIGLSNDLHPLFGTSSYANSYSVTRDEDEYYFPSAFIKLTLLADDTTVIRKGRFNGLGSITTLILGDGITKIYDEAFADCAMLNSVTVPSSLTEIGALEDPEDNRMGVFRNCPHLATLNIPVVSSLEFIGAYAFKDTVLQSVQIPATVTEIGDYAFANTRLTSLIFMAGARPLTIGKAAFYGITTLGGSGLNLIFPSNLVKIDDEAFYGNTLLTRVTLNGSLTDLGKYVFANCDLREFTLPAGVSLYDEEDYCLVYGLLQNNRNLTSLTLYNGITVEDLFISDYPANLASVYIRGGRIIDNQFRNLTSLQLVEMSNVTAIGNYAFYGCTNANLVSITIPAEVTEIGDYAFAGCTGLTNLLIFSGSELESVGINVFAGDIKLRRVIFPETVQNTSWEGIFDGCVSLIETNIPMSVVTIGDNTFNGCSNLEAIDIPDHIEYVGENAFNNCSKAVFENCNFDLLTYLGENAFANCLNLVSFKAENIETIGENAFSGCVNLIEITIIDLAPAHYVPNPERLTTVNVSSSAETIPSLAFMPCTSLVMLFFATDDSGALDAMLTTLSADRDNGNIGSNVGVFISSEMYLALTDRLSSYSASIYSYPTIFSPSDYVLDEETMTAEIISSGGARGVLYIPGEITKGGSAYTVTAIRAGAFRNNTEITSVIIPFTVTSIGNEAFSGCINLAGVTFEAGSNLESIGDYAFEHCESLASFVIPDSVRTIGTGAFYGCESLSDITISDHSKLESVMEFAFGNSAWLENHPGLAVLCDIAIAFGSVYARNGNVTEINAFTLAGVTKIAPFAFFGVLTLTEVAIPDTVKEIGESAFEGCPSLEKIYILSENAEEVGILLTQLDGQTDCTVYVAESVFEALSELIETLSFDVAVS
ncbi:MAG TPA: leucine-rich repeat protein [Clostridia bacterium]|nr:leucine-rich repeat protein [Clostridia bacterium]